MCENDGPKVGGIAWRDLTVGDAETVRDFYQAVVGWNVEAVDMGGYSDFSMIPPGGGGAIAGVCHARGSNAGLPPQWLMYIVVENVDGAAARATELGGAIVDGPREIGGGRMAVIRDPAGAVCALWQAGA